MLRIQTQDSGCHLCLHAPCTLEWCPSKLCEGTRRQEDSQHDPGDPHRLHRKDTDLQLLQTALCPKSRQHGCQSSPHLATSLDPSVWAPDDLSDMVDRQPNPKCKTNSKPNRKLTTTRTLSLILTQTITPDTQTHSHLTVSRKVNLTLTLT